MSKVTKLTAGSLKNELWSTIQSIKTKQISPSTANAIAAQSREIMRIVNTEIKIASFSGKKTISQNLIGGTEA